MVCFVGGIRFEYKTRIVWIAYVIFQTLIFRGFVLMLLAVVYARQASTGCFVLYGPKAMGVVFLG